MSFKDDFPSLKNIHVCRDNKVNIIRNYISLQELELYCLDKQKVKEAISELTLTGYRGNPEGYVNASILLQRLGLGEKDDK